MLSILTGKRGLLQPPIADFWAQVPAQARDAIQDFLAVAVIGGPDKVRAGFSAIAKATQADEFMLVCDVHDPALRLRALDLAAQAMRGSIEG